MSRNMIRIIPLLVMLVLSIILASGLLGGPENRLFMHNSLVGYDMAPFNVPTLGSDQPHFTPKEWKGKTVVLNIFATWCEPCLAEHGALMYLAKTGKVNLYGMAWKESPATVSEWLTKHGNPYHLLGVDQNGSSTIALGLTGVPETFIIGPTGRIFYHEQAPITKETVDQVILPMVEKIQSGELRAGPRTTDADSQPFHVPTTEEMTVVPADQLPMDQLAHPTHAPINPPANPTINPAVNQAPVNPPATTP